MIEDDGAGFELSEVREGGLGLVGMRERVAPSSVGVCRIESGSGDDAACGGAAR